MLRNIPRTYQANFLTFPTDSVPWSSPAGAELGSFQVGPSCKTHTRSFNTNGHRAHAASLERVQQQNPLKGKQHGHQLLGTKRCTLQTGSCRAAPLARAHTASLFLRPLKGPVGPTPPAGRGFSRPRKPDAWVFTSCSFWELLTHQELTGCSSDLAQHRHRANPLPSSDTNAASSFFKIKLMCHKEGTNRY